MINDEFKTRILINSAGLGSERIAEMAGINIDQAGYRLHYCKQVLLRRLKTIASS